jgi:hypothetical protein
LFSHEYEGYDDDDGNDNDDHDHFDHDINHDHHHDNNHDHSSIVRIVRSQDKAYQNLCSHECEEEIVAEWQIYKQGS